MKNNAELNPDWPYAVPRELLEYTAEELEELPVLSQGQADDLHVETPDGWRVWLCRCGVDDGMLYEDMVTVEGYDPKDHRWKTAATYPG
jgi:hypothetical protein